jgi:hypothetical protein
MDGLALIQEATKAGLTVSLEGSSLKVRGPKRLSELAGRLVQNKGAVIAALMEMTAAPAAQIDQPSRVDADTRPEKPAKEPSSVGARGAESAVQEDCHTLHIQPQHWVRREGRAYCPGCERFMGYVRGKP